MWEGVREGWEEQYFLWALGDVEPEGWRRRLCHGWDEVNGWETQEEC